MPASASRAASRATSVAERLRGRYCDLRRPATHPRARIASPRSSESSSDQPSRMPETRTPRVSAPDAPRAPLQAARTAPIPAARDQLGHQAHDHGDHEPYGGKRGAAQGQQAVGRQHGAGTPEPHERRHQQHAHAEPKRKALEPDGERTPLPERRGAGPGEDEIDEAHQHEQGKLPAERPPRPPGPKDGARADKRPHERDRHEHGVQSTHGDGRHGHHEGHQDRRVLRLEDALCRHAHTRRAVRDGSYAASASGSYVARPATSGSASPKAE